jgi:hypothetical protein
MKVGELIAELDRLRSEHGDIDVMCFNRDGPAYDDVLEVHFIRPAPDREEAARMEEYRKAFGQPDPSEAWYRPCILIE